MILILILSPTTTTTTTTRRTITISIIIPPRLQSLHLHPHQLHEFQAFVTIKLREENYIKGSPGKIPMKFSHTDSLPWSP